VLNQNIVEKVGIYLHPDKVLKAAGVDPNAIPVKEKEKLDRRFKRMFITRNSKKLAVEQSLQQERYLEQIAQDFSDSGMQDDK
jgi:hypothetical protein